jgi:hypothetical protein
MESERRKTSKGSFRISEDDAAASAVIAAGGAVSIP